MSRTTSTMHTNVLRRPAEELSAKYSGVFSPATVERYVFESYTTLSRTAKIRTHLVNTSLHFAETRLRALAQAEGKIASPVPQVLFVSVHNMGRSQIAAALLSFYAGDQVEVRSAGSLPASNVHPLVIQILTERGLDISEAYPKPLTEDVVRAAGLCHHHGLRGRLPHLPRHTVPGLGSPRSGRRNRRASGKHRGPSRCPSARAVATNPKMNATTRFVWSGFASGLHCAG